MSVHIY